MIYWNQIAYEILTKLTEKIKNSTLESGFFLLEWPANVGKKTAVFEIINSLWVLPQDLMIIEDPGKLDGNLYQIKVDIPEKERVLHIQEKDFLNVGARQIVEFLSTTSFGNYKVVFIENIERMNISSANALLKKLEEPGKGNFIFATSSNKDKLLSTIVSRAFLINFYPISFDEFNKFLDDHHIVLEDVKKHILYAVSAGRIGLVKKLLEEWNDLLDKIQEYLELEENWKEIFSKFSLLKDLMNQQKISFFLDWLLFYYSHSWNFQNMQKLVEIKKRHNANVNLENLLFEYLLYLHSKSKCKKLEK